MYINSGGSSNKCQQWTFVWVYEKGRSGGLNVCSLDPGVREWLELILLLSLRTLLHSFTFRYSPTRGSGHIGNQDT